MFDVLGLVVVEDILGHGATVTTLIEGLNIRIPIIIPIKGRGVIYQGSGFGRQP